MKFNIEQARLAAAVAQVSRALPQRPTAPVLGGIRLHAGPGTVQLSAFDYETSCLGGLDTDVAEPGTAIVPGKLLAEIVRSLPAKPAELATDGTRLTLRCGAARFALMMLPAGEYPALPEMPPLAGTIGSDALAAAVAQVAVAVAKDDTLPALTAIKVQAAGGLLTLAAADRYRAAVTEVPWAPAEPGFEATALIPARALADVARYATAGPQTTIRLAPAEPGRHDGGIAGFEAAGWQTTTRLLAGEYPRFSTLFPAAFSCTAKVPVAGFTEAVRRVALVAAKGTPVRITFTGNQALFQAGAGDEAHASEELAVTYEGEPGSSGSFGIAFNPDYLTDALTAAGADTALISMTAPNKPAVITPAGDSAGYRHVLVPVRAVG